MDDDVKIPTIARLARLAMDRADIMERLQNIDDEASALLTDMENDRESTRATWQHLLPRLDRPQPVDLRPAALMVAPAITVRSGSPYFNTEGSAYSSPEGR